jgi:hypothetical protein
MLPGVIRSINPGRLPYSGLSQVVIFFQKRSQGGAVQSQPSPFSLLSTRFASPLSHPKTKRFKARALQVFADFGSGMVRIGQLGIRDNSTRSADTVLPSKPKKVALNAYKEILER